MPSRLAQAIWFHARSGIVAISGLVLMSAAMLYSIASLDSRASTQGVAGPGIPSVLSVLGMVLTVLGLALRACITQPHFAHNSHTLGRLQLYDRVLYGALYSTIALAGLTWMLWTYRVDDLSYWPDTQTYAQVADKCLCDISFWAGKKPFVLPLLFKLLGLTSRTIDTSQVRLVSIHVTRLQSLLSLSAFALLGLSVASVQSTRWLRPLALLVMLAFGLASTVSQWNKVLMSESISTTLFALLAAISIVATRLRERSSDSSRLFRLVAALVFIVIAAFFSFSRDVNAYLLLLLGALMLLAIFLPSVRFREGRKSYLPVALAMIFIFALQSASIGEGERWLYPFNNVLRDRILPDPVAVRFFAARGLPVQVVSPLPALDRTELQSPPQLDPHSAALLDWVLTHGRRTYLEFLLSNPLTFLEGPLVHLEELVSPRTDYRVRLHPEPTWFQLADSILDPKSVPFLAAWLVALVAALLAMRGRVHPSWIILGALLVSVYPIMLVVWYGDTREIPRHAYTVGVQLRLALWILSMLVLDAAAATYRSKRRPEASSVARQARVHSLRGEYGV